MRHTAARLVLAGLLALAGGGDDVSDAAGGGATSTTEARATTTAPADHATTTTASSGEPAGGAVGDYEGQRFDFGAITLAESVDGEVWIQFNRQQLYQDDGSLASGAQLTEEPVLYGSTDVPYVDESPQLRRFVVAPDAAVLQIEAPIPCASDEEPGEPIWTTVGPAELLDGAWRTRQMDSLTFGDDGRVSQVRLSAAC